MSVELMGRCPSRVRSQRYLSTHSVSSSGLPGHEPISDAENSGKASERKAPLAASSCERCTDTGMPAVAAPRSASLLREPILSLLRRPRSPPLAAPCPASALLLVAVAEAARAAWGATAHSPSGLCGHCCWRRSRWASRLSPSG